MRRVTCNRYTTITPKKVRFRALRLQEREGMHSETASPRGRLGDRGVMHIIQLRLPYGAGSYFLAAAGAAPVVPGVSFGGTPITLTPAPREMSIASMISPYFTPAEPFTKMIFSGRGS